MMLCWHVTVWDGNTEVDHIFFPHDEKQERVIQYMLERVYGAKQYEFAKDVEDGDDVVVIHDKKVKNKVDILCTNLTADITIEMARMTLVLDLGYTPHKMTVTEVESDDMIICTGCSEFVQECGYCEVDGSPYGDCCWSEHIDSCDKCRDLNT